MTDNNRPIVVKRIKKGKHDAHGGSWKVAYADFMTAMMAFFLLMWILQTASKEQKAGIAQYFTTGSIMNSSTAGGVSILTGGTESLETAAAPQAFPFVGFDGSNEYPVFSPDAKRLVEIEKELFDRARIALMEAMQSDPALMELHDSLIINRSKDGLNIQLTDRLEQSIFMVGSDVLTPNGERLTALLANVLKQMPHKLAIEGHTDAAPFIGKNRESNWELSSRRALAFRRRLIALGVKDEKIVRVVGKAATEPLLKKDPKAPQNRRVGVTLLSLAREAEKDEKNLSGISGSVVK